MSNSYHSFCYNFCSIFIINFFNKLNSVYGLKNGSTNSSIKDLLKIFFSYIISASDAFM